MTHFRSSVDQPKTNHRQPVWIQPHPDYLDWLCRRRRRKYVRDFSRPIMAFMDCKTVLTIWLGVTLASQRSIGRGYAAALMFIPALLGAILVQKLPSHDKVGLLFSYWISSKLIISLPSVRSGMLILSCSFHVYALRHSSWMGRFYYCRTHEAYVLPSNSVSVPFVTDVKRFLSRHDHERDYPHCVRYRQCSWSIYVEETISAPVCSFRRHAT